MFAFIRKPASAGAQLLSDVLLSSIANAQPAQLHNANS